MRTSTYKTSTIFVGTGRKTRVFRSLEEVPSDLRKRLQDNLSGPNTRTLIVADRRGREYLVKALQRATGNTGRCETHAPRRRQQRPRTAWQNAKRYWLEIALIGALGLAIWALFYTR